MATKKSATKKTATKSSSRATKASSKKKPTIKSFKACPNPEPFMTLKVTNQTIYWLIIGVISIIFVWYTFAITETINDIYNQIDAIQAADVISAPILNVRS